MKFLDCHFYFDAKNPTRKSHAQALVYLTIKLCYASDKIIQQQVNKLVLNYITPELYNHVPVDSQWSKKLLLINNFTTVNLSTITKIMHTK